MTMSTTPERVDGPTPNGGAYCIAYFHDNGAMEIVEFDANDQVIQRTYSEPKGATPAEDVILVDENGNQIKRTVHIGGKRPRTEQV